MGNLKLSAGGGKGITKWDQSGWDASARLNTLNKRDKLLQIAAAKIDISRPHGAGLTVLGIAWLDGLSDSEEEKNRKLMLLFKCQPRVRQKKKKLPAPPSTYRRGGDFVETVPLKVTVLTVLCLWQAVLSMVASFWKRHKTALMVA